MTICQWENLCSNLRSARLLFGKKKKNFFLRPHHLFWPMFFNLMTGDECDRLELLLL